MRDHGAIRELLGVYALDAVEDDERAEIEAHLEGCADCRVEVAGHRSTAASLVDVDAPPPAGVWTRVQAQLERPAVGAPASMARRRMRLSQRFVAGLAAAAVVLVAALTFQVASLGRRLDAFEGDGSVEVGASRALADPRAVRLVLRSDDGALVADAVVLPDGRGYLVQNNLPALPGDRTYQLWSLVDGRAVSAGVLGNDPRTAGFSVAPGTAGLAITEERAGGVAQPESTPLVRAQLRLL